MQKVSRQIFIELMWLALSFVVTILLSLFLFGRNFISAPIDIHLHDTYFVIAPFYILLPIFFMVTFLVCFIKEFRKSFYQTLPNCVLIITGLALVISLTFLIKAFSEIVTNGLTLYPPLSALDPDKVSELTQTLVTKLLTSVFTVVQSLVLVMLLYATFHWGRQGQKKIKI